MEAREALRRRIAAALGGLHYPIRNAEELSRELGDSRVRGFCAGRSFLGVAEAVELLCPRDFLFTNAQQIADVVAARATPRHDAAARAVDPAHRARTEAAAAQENEHVGLSV